MAQTPGRYVPGLTGLRGVAAVAVAVFHFQGAVVGLDLGPITGFIRNSHLWVDLFFVLSGFVMAHAYEGKALKLGAEYRSFVLFRLSRIYPVHVLVLVGFFALEVFKAILAARGQGFTEPPFEGSMAPSLLIASALLAHSFGLTSQLGWNGPSWSISAEWVSYLAFPFIRVALGRVSSRGCWLAVVAGYAGLLVLAVCRGTIDLTHDLGALRAMLSFGAGVALHRIWLSGRVPEMMRRPYFSLLSFAATLFMLASPWGDFALVLMFPPLLLSTAQPNSAMARLMERRVFRLLGDVSYSVYMLHMLLLTVCQLALVRVLHLGPLSASGSWLYLVGWLLALLALSVLSYSYFELPTMRWIRRLSKFPTASRT